MKKIYIILVTIVTLGMTSSCSDYLSIDKYVNDMLTLDTVFLRKNYTEEWLWNTYSYLNNAGAEIANKGTNCFSFASDEAIFGDWWPRCRIYQNCEYTANDGYEDRWGAFISRNTKSFYFYRQSRRLSRIGGIAK